jgi:hypothetical protein
MMCQSHSGSKTAQLRPSFEALPHNPGEVSSFLSTTSKLRCRKPALRVYFRLSSGVRGFPQGAMGSCR